MSDNYLRFWGVRGSYASPQSSHHKVGGNTSCIEISIGDHLLICDAGTGIISLGQEMMFHPRPKKVLIVLTHYHWDHICGLPFFAPAFSTDWNISFFGPGENEVEVKQTLASQMQAPYFPIGTESWNANINYLNPSMMDIEYGQFKVLRHCVHHPGLTYGYRIKIGEHSIVYISDNECRFLDKSIKTRWNEFDEEEQKILEEMNREEYEIELNAIRDADILIHDSQYTLEDYEHKRGWGHSCYVDTVKTAIDANVKSLYLYHHDPAHDDETMEVILKDSLEIIKSHQVPMNCDIAREGAVIDLTPLLK